MTQAQHIAERYIATWNETDALKRRRLLQADWTPEATYVDPLAKVSGQAEIDGMIGAVHQRFAGFSFALKGQPDGHGDHVRFSWSLGPAGQEAPIEGSDVVMTFNGKIACVIGFLDKVPVPA
jgi:hypothetical protein